MTSTIYFHIETTGFEKSDEIIQIAACSHEHPPFDVYITPTRQVHQKAYEVSGLHLRDGDLYCYRRKLESISAKEAFEMFMQYLNGFNGDAILVTHNCFRFGMRRILNLAGELGFFDQFKILIKGFNDSLYILRDHLKERREQKKKFSLQELLKDYLPCGSTYYSQYAQNKAEILQKLLETLKINDQIFLQSPKSLEDFLCKEEIKLQKENADLDE